VARRLSVAWIAFIGNPFLSLLVMVLGWSAPAQKQALAATPNIVYILADDMGIGDIRSYTANSPVNTPNIDRIANEGIRFDNARSSSSVCSPTRYALLTGRYSWRGPLTGPVVPVFRPSVVEPARLTVAEMLKQSGYNTALIGKWHLGLNWVTTNGQPANSTGTNVDYTQPFTGGPLDHGFDSYYGDDVINWPPFTMIRDNQTVGIPVGNAQGQPYTPPGGTLPGLVTPGYTTAGSLPSILDEMETHIGTVANQAAPFYLHFPITAPHYPIVPPPELQGSTGTNAYGDFIATVDWAVGRVFAALEDPNNDGDSSDSVLDDTIILFGADNGAETGTPCGAEAFCTSPGFVNGVPLRGDKASVYEGGHHVPFLVRWHGEVDPGSVSTQMVELQDFMATAADIVGYQLPANAAEDSFTLAPMLRGQLTQPVRSAGVQHSYIGAKVIRQTDASGNEWKLIFSSNDGGFSGSAINPLNPITNFGLLQLFNLTVDPGETTNLLAGGGTQAMQQKTLELQSLLIQLMNAGRTAPTKSTGDFNGDHIVDLDDLFTWRAAFGSTTNLGADANANGVVDAGDYVVWRHFYLPPGGSGSGGRAHGAVPEPSTLLMVGVGGVSLGCFIRSNRSLKKCRWIRRARPELCFE
jgi:arylsulfatase A-like enzyme